MDPEAGTMVLETEDADELFTRIRRVFAGEYEVEREIARGGMAIVYQATPRDPIVMIGAVLVMLALGLLATWVPAQRALSADPLLLLREE